MVKNPKRSTKSFVPKFISKQHQLIEYKIKGRKIVTVEPVKRKRKIHLIYLHGGAYIFEISSMHWKFVNKLQNKIGAIATVVQYPLTPENTYKETIEMVMLTYQHLTEIHPEDKFVLIGDSAGAGLSMVIAQLIGKDTKLKPLSALVLLSPYLDMSLSADDMSEVEDLDQILSVEMLTKSGLLYAGGEALDNPLLSPIFGDYDKLPFTAVFYGTHELFYLDCLSFKERLSPKNKVSFYEYKDMQHTWMLFPIEEQNMVIENISDFLSKI